MRSSSRPGDATGGAEGERGGGRGGDNNQLRLNPVASALDLDPARRRRLMRKLYLRTVPVACLITCATFIDRSNLALAAPVLLYDIGLSRPQFGFASAVMFVSYGLCMWLSALMFTVISLRVWFCVIVSAWGAITALTAVVGVAGMKASTSFALLVVLRLALGAAEAGTMPGCFFLLSRFLPKREMAYAYSWVRRRRERGRGRGSFSVFSQQPLLDLILISHFQKKKKKTSSALALPGPRLHRARPGPRRAPGSSFHRTG